MSIITGVQALIDRNEELEGERKVIAAILARFAAAPISISSIQPLLELNDRLNGGKK